MSSSIASNDARASPGADDNGGERVVQPIVEVQNLIERLVVQERA
jgi:hypothetical protein